VAVDPARTFKPINIAVLTVSDTRGPENDTSGEMLAERIKAAGHHLVARAIEKDDVEIIANRLNNWIDDQGIY
jgi:molybdenum cofactor biosynthesis protein B